MTEARRYLVLAKRVFDGTGGAPVEDGAVLVDSGIIRAVGARDQIDVPPDTQVVDLGEQTVTPGIVDAHMHFYGVPSTVLHSAPFEDEGLRALRAASEATRMLEAGITTARCCGSAVGPALRRAVEAGYVHGPRIVAVGKLLCTTAGTHDPESGLLLPHDWAKAQGLVGDGPHELRELVRQRIRAGATAIKIGVSKTPWYDAFGVWGDNPRNQLPAVTRDELDAIVDEAHANDLRVCAHAIGDGPVRLAIDARIDTIEHGFGISDETRAILAERGTPVVTTFCAMYLMRESIAWSRFSPREQEAVQRHIDTQREDFQKGLAAGVRYALGTDLIGSPTHPNDRAALEFELAVRNGMAPADAIVAGTAAGAEAVGLGDTIGTLEPGKEADLIGVPGDPIADISTLQRVGFVMQQGRIVMTRDAARDRRAADTEAPDGRPLATPTPPR